MQSQVTPPSIVRKTYVFPVLLSFFLLASSFGLALQTPPAHAEKTNVKEKSGKKDSSPKVRTRKQRRRVRRRRSRRSQRRRRVRRRRRYRRRKRYRRRRRRTRRRRRYRRRRARRRRRRSRKNRRRSRRSRRRRRRKGRRARRKQRSIERRMRRKIRRLRRWHAVIPMSVVSYYMSRMHTLSGDVVVVPHQKRGVSGFRMAFLRKYSAIYRLGFRKGDVITSINGYRIDTPTRAMLAYVALRKHTTFLIQLRRRGRPYKHLIEIKGK